MISRSRFAISLPARSLPALALALAAAGCGGAAVPADEPAAAAAAAGGPTTRCYAGTSRLYALPANQHVGDGTIVARRTTDPAASTVTEDVVSAFPGQPTRRFRVTMQVTGARFTMTEAGGAFTGEGALVGPSWAWTEWTATTRLPDGSVVRSRDVVAGAGFTAEKTVTSADGVDRLRIAETIGGLDCGAFEAKAGAL